MYRKPVHGWKKHLDFMVLDVICLHLGIVLAYGIRYDWQNLPYSGKSRYLPIVILLTLLDVAVAVLGNSFSKVLQRRWPKELYASLRHVFLVYALLALYLFTAQSGDAYSRITIGLTALFHLLLAFLGRQAYKALRWGREVPARSMLIVSTRSECEKAIESLREDRSGSIQLAGIALLDEDRTGQRIGGVDVVANRDTVYQYVCREWVDEVYVRLPRQMEVDKGFYRSLQETGVTVHIDATAFEPFAGSDVLMEKIGSSFVLTTSMKMASPGQLMLKRLMDILGGLVGSVLTVFVALAIAIPIKRQSPGPLFFVQERIGQNGKRFRMIKFRSMYLDAEKRKQELMDQNRVSDGRMFKLDWDPRIIGNEVLPDGSHKTGIGEFIRKTSLDEFPQFFNVLKGDMSLVGTRPPTVDEWEKYELHHRARLSTKPGITGMWQVSGRSDITDFEEITRLDTEYIANWSIGLDIRILIKTVGAVVNRKGAM